MNEAVEPRSLVDLLRRRAREQPDDLAYILLSERGEKSSTLSFATLLARAASLAEHLRARGTVGDRALLLFPTSAECLIAFFACLIAGVVAVPMPVPRRVRARDATESIVRDCSPRFALTTARLIEDTRPDIVPRFSDFMIEWICVDRLAPDDRPRPDAFPQGDRDDIAFLQYTSGSTSTPKGVMVSHGNLLANARMIQQVLGTDRTSTCVAWVPLFHDMGLILNALQSFYLGATCVLMPPAGFIRRPLLWLKAIEEYHGVVASAPNFAFDLCVDQFDREPLRTLDLSSWKVALIGAEPVRATTLARFSERFGPRGLASETMSPAYGMAEATLLISASQPGEKIRVREISRSAIAENRIELPAGPDDCYPAVGCGRALRGERIAIVDPDTLARLPTDTVGEVWVQGANVARGYWRNAEATEATFRACIAGAAEDGTWLRTGDLGFLDDDGVVYITGRLKDLIIIRGNNHYPQDIEATTQACHPALRRDAGAAFSALDPDDAERLIIVQEIERTADPETLAAIVGLIRERVTEQHEISPDEIILIRASTLPKTSSGKIQRAQTRASWLRGTLERRSF